MAAGEVVQLVTEALTPILRELNRQSEERLQNLMTEANRQITRLEQEIVQLRERPPQRRDAPVRNMMESKAFTKIDKFRDGHAKWKSIRSQIENLAELTFPGIGRNVLQWARSIGIDELRYNREANTFNFLPPAETTHLVAFTIGSDLAIALTYVLEGEAEAILTNSGDGNGLEAWRRLQQRFDPRSNARDLVDTQRIIKPTPCKTMQEVLPALEKWEDSLRQMNDANRPPEMMMMAIVIGMMPAKLQDYLQDLEERIRTYAQLRAEIIRKVDLAEVRDMKSDRRTSVNTNDMDVSYLSGQSLHNVSNDPYQWNDTSWSWPSASGNQDYWPSQDGAEIDLNAIMKGGKKGGKKGENKGYGKGAWNPWYQNKGKGEFKGKGKPQYGKGSPYPGKGAPQNPGKGANQEFRGYCYGCGAWGHKGANCPSAPKQDANSLMPSNSETEAHPDMGEPEVIQMGSLMTVQERHIDGHFHWDFLNPERIVRWGDVEVDEYEPLYDNIQTCPHNDEDNNREIRFGTIDVPVPTKNRFSILSPIEEKSEYVSTMTLDRMPASRHVDVGNITKQPREYDKSGKFVRLTCTSDSGAGESVLPASWFPEVPSQQSEESNTTYVAANGSALPNQGKKTLEGVNANGARVRMEWQLANVTKPLASIGKLTSKGHRVVFDDAEQGGGYIVHKSTNTKTPIRKRNGTYEFDLWVKVPEAASVSAGFTRQGNP